VKARRRDKPQSGIFSSPSAAAAVVRSSLRGLALRLGLDVRRVSQTGSPTTRRLHALREYGINVVLDVGASYGQYAKLLVQSGYRGRIVSFEPLPQPYRVLAARAGRNPAWTCFPVAIGDRSERTTMNAARDSISSSILPVTDRHLSAAPSSAPAGEVPVEVARLDDLAPRILEPDDRAFLKLDVQGHEKAALEGAQETLSQVDVIEAELSLVELYQGQPLFEEVYGFIKASGFRCVGIEPEFVEPVRGYLLQVNGLFIRDIAA
jgi:FkbM family methyltransferase